MRLSITIRAEHMGGPCDVSVESVFEPGSNAWNVETYKGMVISINGLLDAMFTERDRLRFEEEREVLRSTVQRARESTERNRVKAVQERREDMGLSTET